jgi:branched-chain amino acid transport system substrate-binding protein
MAPAVRPSSPTMLRAAAAALACAGTFAVAPAAAQNVTIPVLVPVTGFLSIEGASQRNGALLGFRRAPKGITVNSQVSDTGTSPDVAVNALERVISRDKPIAVVASMLGTQMLAMLPVGGEAKLPMLTVSGTAAITEQKNPYVFRFFPGDAVAKQAHVRYALEELKKRRVALVYQTTAYGQSGRNEIVALLKKAGVDPVMQEALETTVRDMSPVIGKVKAANPDVVLIHLHAQPSALFIRAAVQAKLGLPILAGSSVHQPPTAALLEPAELAGVCAETNASPVSAENADMRTFLKLYRDEFASEPDGYALAQYDAVQMALDAVAKGAKTPADLQKALSGTTYKGLGMSYKSDGKGNMAHSAVMICYDGKSRVPKVAKRYENVTGVLN